MGLNYGHGMQLFNLVGTDKNRQLCLQIVILHTLMAIPVGERLPLSDVKHNLRPSLIWHSCNFNFITLGINRFCVRRARSRGMLCSTQWAFLRFALFGFHIAAITCRVAPGYYRHCAQACSVIMSPSKLNAFDRCDDFDCSKQKSLIK